MSFSRSRWMVLPCLALAFGGVSVLACSDDPKPVTTTVTDAGKSDTGTTGGDGAAVETIYTRLKGHAGIQAFVKAVVDRVLMDPQQASYFALIFDFTKDAKHPTRAQIEECFVNLVGANTGGTELYPGVAKDSMGWQCRDMKTTHANLRIPNGVFNDFVGYIVEVATKAGVSMADIGAMGTLLGTTKASIVDPAAGDAGYFDSGAKPTDAATGG